MTSSGLFGENAAEFGLPCDRPPAGRRTFAGVAPGRRLSALDADGNAADVAAVIRQLAPSARAVAGMSLGGLTAIALSAVRRNWSAS